MQGTPDWQDLKLFAAIARGGGLAPAARETGVSAPTLGRRMSALEATLGRRLFERGARGYALTGEGETLFDHVARMSEAAEDIVRGEDGGATRPTVRVSAGGWTMSFLIANLAAFWDESLDWIPELITDYARRDVGRREIDIGVRAGRPVEPWLAGRRVGTVDYAVYRAASLPPDAPVAGWIGVGAEHPGAPTGDWRRERHGADWTLEVNTPSQALPLVRQGLARMAIPCFAGDADPALARDGGTLDEFRHERWLVVHQDHRHRPPVRSAIEALAGFFGAGTPTG